MKKGTIRVERALDSGGSVTVHHDFTDVEVKDGALLILDSEENKFNFPKVRYNEGAWISYEVTEWPIVGTSSAG